MLVRLMYASRATAPLRDDELQAIVAKSRVRNPLAGVTGVLCSSGEVFLQVLEGGRAEVNTLYNRIVADSRHRDVTLLSYEEIKERRFAGWSMGQANLSRINPAILLKYSEKAVLDPYAVSAEASMALFEELMATASIMVQCS